MTLHPLGDKAIPPVTSLREPLDNSATLLLLLPPPMVSRDLIRFLLAGRPALIFTAPRPLLIEGNLVVPSCSASSSCGWRATNNSWSVWVRRSEWSMCGRVSLALLCTYLCPSVAVVEICRPPASSHRCALPPSPHRLPTLLFVRGGRQNQANPRVRQARQACVERQRLAVNFNPNSTSTTTDTAMTPMVINSPSIIILPLFAFVIVQSR